MTSDLIPYEPMGVMTSTLSQSRTVETLEREKEDALRKAGQAERMGERLRKSAETYQLWADTQTQQAVDQEMIAMRLTEWAASLETEI